MKPLPSPGRFTRLVCLLVLGWAWPAGAYRALVTDGFHTSATSAVATLTIIPVPAGSYLEAVLTNRPVAFWRLGELAGDTAFDYAGGNHGRYARASLGQPGALSNDPDTSVRFNGSSSWVGSGVSLANHRAAFTLEGWFKLSATPGRMGLWGQNDAIEFGLSDAATIQIWTPGGGIWDADGNWFRGWIDDVAFYDRARTAAEVQRHHLLGLALPAILPGLHVSGDNVEFQFAGTLGRDYRVEFTPVLPAPGPWLVVTNTLPLTTSPSTVSVPMADPLGFYRIGLAP